MRLALISALLGSVVAISTLACSSDKDTQPTTTTTTSTPTTSAVSTSTTTALQGAATTPVSTPDQGHSKLTALTVENKGSFDRLTYTFSSGIPGYVVEYTSRPIQEDASGKTVEVKGDSVLRMRFAGASTVDLSGGKVTETYSGPKRFSPDTPQVVEVVETGDFEDVLNWVAGVKGRPGFKVGTNTAANQITVDIAHTG